MRDSFKDAVSRFEELLFAAPKAVIALILLVTAFFALQLPRLQIYSDLADLLPQNHPYIHLHNEIRNTFGGTNLIVVGVEVENGTIFTNETLGLIHRITQSVDSLPSVNHNLVSSLTHRTARKIAVDETGSVTSKTYYDPTRVDLSEQELDQLKQDVQANPRVFGFMVSPDMKAALIRAQLNEQGIDYSKTFEALQRIRTAEARPEVEIYATGQPVLIGWVYTYLSQILQIFLYTAALIVALLIMHFRTWYGVLLPLLGILLSTTWGLGFVSLIGYNLDLLNLVIPFLIAARATSHGVQLVERYYGELAVTGNSNQAARNAFDHLFRPGSLAIVVDAVGILIIALGAAPINTKLGYYAAFWAFSVIFTVLLMTPLLLAVLPQSKTMHKEALPLRKLSTAAILAAVGGRARAVGTLVVAAVLLVIAGVIMWVFCSDLRFQSDSALLLSIMLVLNAAAAMVLVPAWIGIFKPRFIVDAYRGSDDILVERDLEKLGGAERSRVGLSWLGMGWPNHRQKLQTEKPMHKREGGATKGTLWAFIVGNLCVVAMWPWTPASAQEAGEASPWKVDTFYENATFVREHVGLSKFRNTLQIEADRKLGPSGGFSNGNLHVVLRGTYDGVYRLNSREFGNKAGGAITLQNGVPGLDYSAAFGAPAGALVGTEGVLQGGGLQLFNAANVLANNPNEGMIVLGSRLHDQGGGIAFGVPVRPCDVDSRGCLKGYMDASRRELESPEFNSRIDFIRELAWSGSTPLGDGKELFIKVGKQQIVWGRTDLFRVLDVINPIDYSRQNIFDEAQDIRIPRWIAQGEYRMGATGPLSDLNLQVVWNFDKFRPHNLGQGGSPYSIIDAGSFFRGMKNLWDNGGTVANFAAAGVFGPTPGLATTFGPNQIGIRQADMPRWSLSNTQLGAKLEGVYKSASFSLNALTYRSQLPSLHGGIASVNPFTGVVGNYSFVPAFDIVFPRVNLLGGSMDLPLEDGKSSIRLESTFTRGEEFPNTLQPFGFSKSRVVRYVIGFDRPTFIPFLNAQRTFLLSGQLFGQHLLDHQLDDGPLGKRGIPDWKHNHIATLLFKGFYYNDRLSPQLLMAHDLKAHATVWGPSVEWLVTDSLKVALGANIKTGTGAQQFDDGRTANPFPPFTGPGPVAPSLGLGGFEPLGRFLAGPIGMARNENELQFTLRYKF